MTSNSRALVPDLAGRRSLPETITWDDARSLLQLLPQDLPPYATAARLSGTPYRLEELLGTGGFGAVYRASSPTLQHLPLAIKFCLDRSLLPALNLERSNLERLMRAAGESGSVHVVKLFGYDLEHPTPYLVYEYVPGGDLTEHLARHRAENQRGLTPGEVLGVVTQLAEGLAFAHRVSLVHRDVKPANVLVDGGVMKLADFGLGGLAVQRAVERSRIGATTIDYLSLAERASLFRGAGTPLYMSPEQRRGANPDPRHDLYSLGVLWFQLLAGDVTRELHPGWAKELAVRFGVPAGHISLIDHCVGWFDERPKDAGELLPLLRQTGTDATAIRTALPVSMPYSEPASRPAADTQTAVVTPSVIPADSIRKARLLELLRGLQTALVEPKWPARRTILVITSALFVTVALITAAVMATDRSLHHVSTHTDPIVGYSRAEIVTASPAVGAPVSLVLTGILAVALRLHAGRRLDGVMRRALAALRSEFPAEVEAWGGLERLTSPAVVEAVLEQATRPDFRVGPAPSRPLTQPEPPEPRAVITPEMLRADPMRLNVFRNRLFDFQNARTSASLTNIMLGIVILALALPLGCILAVVTVQESQRGMIRGVDGIFAILLGVLIWLGVFGLPCLIWWLVHRALRTRLRKRADDLTSTYSPVFDQWGGPGFLFDSQALQEVIGDLQRPRAHSQLGSVDRSE